MAVLTIKDFISLLEVCDQDKALTVYNVCTGDRYYLDRNDIDFDIEGHVEININE